MKISLGRILGAGIFIAFSALIFNDLWHNAAVKQKKFRATLQISAEINHGVPSPASAELGSAMKKMLAVSGARADSVLAETIEAPSNRGGERIPAANSVGLDIKTDWKARQADAATEELQEWPRLRERLERTPETDLERRAHLLWQFTYLKKSDRGQIFKVAIRELELPVPADVSDSDLSGIGPLYRHTAAALGAALEECDSLDSALLAFGLAIKRTTDDENRKALLNYFDAHTQFVGAQAAARQWLNRWTLNQAAKPLRSPASNRP